MFHGAVGLPAVQPKAVKPRTLTGGAAGAMGGLEPEGGDWGCPAQRLHAEPECPPGSHHPRPAGPALKQEPCQLQQFFLERYGKKAENGLM